MKQEQIQKLKSLGELLANGTISNEEFNTLKAEILNQKIQNNEHPFKKQPAIEMDKIIKLTELKKLLIGTISYSLGFK